MEEEAAKKKKKEEEEETMVMMKERRPVLRKTFSIQRHTLIPTMQILQATMSLRLTQSAVTRMRATMKAATSFLQKHSIFKTDLCLLLMAVSPWVLAIAMIQTGKLTSEDQRKALVVGFMDLGTLCKTPKWSAPERCAPD